MTAVTPTQTTVAASSLLLKSGPGVLDWFEMSSSASGYCMVFDAVVVPADGTVTPLLAFPLAAAGAAYATVQSFFSTPVRFATGCLVVCSSSGPFSKTAQATAFIAGQVE